MKIFISWSGNRSRAVAEIIRDWTKCVIQASRPWISTRDIDRGALWFTEINDQLKETSVGIICLTQENKNRPWLLFEAGALAKGLSSNRVCTLLVDLKPADLEDPLAQFNHTYPEKESMWSLMRTLNGCLGTNGLEDRILQEIFDTYWPQFETKFKNALKENAPTEKVEPRSEKVLLAEILENTRSFSQRLRRLESAQEASAEPEVTREARRMPLGFAARIIRDMAASGIEHSKIIQAMSERAVPASFVMRELASIERRRDNIEVIKVGEQTRAAESAAP
jgi:hypothetical protein